MGQNPKLDLAEVSHDQLVPVGSQNMRLTSLDSVFSLTRTGMFWRLGALQENLPVLGIGPD